MLSYLTVKIVLALASIGFAIGSLYVSTKKRHPNEISIEVLSKSLRIKKWLYAYLFTVVALHVIFQAPIPLSLLTFLFFSLQFIVPSAKRN
ncbi:MAG: hypothetical protein ACRCXZ_07355 [Patescibacteria group bacterium]